MRIRETKQSRRQITLEEYMLIYSLQTDSIPIGSLRDDCKEWIRKNGYVWGTIEYNGECFAVFRVSEERDMTKYEEFAYHGCCMDAICESNSSAECKGECPDQCPFVGIDCPLVDPDFDGLCKKALEGKEVIE